MGIRINQNIMAMNSYRNLTTSESQLSKSLEKLSSGFRINKAADDASGLVISEGLRSQVMGLKMAIRNTQDGVSVVQTAEGALTEVHSLLQRIRELAVQAASTGSSDPAARDAAQAEVSQLLSEVNRISDTTKFGGQNLLNGTYGVTQASATGANSANDMTNFVITAAGNDVIGLHIKDVDGVDIFNGNVTLTAAAVGTTNATELANNINGAILTAGGAAAAAAVTASVELGNDGFFQVTLTGNDGSKFDVTGGTALADLGLVAVAAYAGGAAPYASFHQATGDGGVFQVGTDASDTIDFAIGDTDTTALGINAINISTDASGALALIDDAIEDISVLRGDLGALQNRFEHTIANLSVTVENLSASESRIRDTDMASEMMSFTRAQILQQAGTAMLAQANSVPQSVLQLLQ